MCNIALIASEISTYNSKFTGKVMHYEVPIYNKLTNCVMHTDICYPKQKMETDKDTKAKC